MRETMERFSILHFSIGCASHSSVDVIDNQPKKSNREPNPSPPCGEGEEKLNAKPNNISEKLQKLVKGFKSLPQVFHREAEVMEIEIGSPTDVQHVGHVGWDGSNNTSVSTMKTWDRAPEFMPFPSVSLSSGASL